MLQHQSRIYKILLILFLSLSVVAMSGCGLADMIVVNTLPVPDTTSTDPGDSSTERIRPPVIFRSEQDWEGTEISGYREGRLRPGITGFGKTYDCNDDRVYFLLKRNDGAMLCYGTHDSNLFLPLCQNTYCSHTMDFCQAKFENFGSVCSYEDFVYVSAGSALYRLNPDGTERELVIDVMEGAEAYTAIENPKIWNGVFTFDYIPMLSTEDSVPGYYLLNGTMEKPQLMAPAVPLHNEGNTFLVYSQEEGNTALCSWNPYSNSLKQLKELSTPDLLRTGYWGGNSKFYFRDQVIYKMDHETGTEEPLFDTGLLGEYRLYCFPDCLLLCQRGEGPAGIYIYDWESRFRGHVELPQDAVLNADQFICGESRDRIYLAFHNVGVPEAYIDKYDFGMEEVELHWLEYHLPAES